MSFETQTTRIEQLVLMIDSNKTGSAEELVKRLGISRRTIFKDIDFLRGRGMSIAFDPSVRSYRFEKKLKKFQFF